MRSPQVGDVVTIHSSLCEWDGVSGRVIDITNGSMPVMVQRPDFDIWPFEVHELELHSLDDEKYIDGWIHPWLRSQTG